jgi:ribonuclease HII
MARGNGSRAILTEPHVERLIWSAGLRWIAGVDEVGMGPLAGPVVAAAVVLQPGDFLAGIADSKRLTAAGRERAAALVRARAAGVGLGVVGPEEIDRLNIYRAGLRAMRLAVEALPFVPEYLLVDGRHVPGLATPQTSYAGGDAFVHSIAAASIVAKVHRDALMHELDARYPQYGFRRHVGYATREHLRALRTHGPSPLHRHSFAPCRTAPSLPGPPAR